MSHLKRSDCDWSGLLLLSTTGLQPQRPFSMGPTGGLLGQRSRSVPQVLGMAGQELIRQQESELRQVLDLTPQPVAVFGPNRERLYAKRPALDYFGLTLEQWQAITDPLWFFYPDDRERVAKEVYADAASGVAHEFEARMRRHDGEHRWFLFRDNPLRDEQGRIKRWYLSATDIEDRKQVEQELRASESRFRTFVDHAMDAFFLHDEELRTIDVNHQACHSLGYSREELIGTRPHDFDVGLDPATIARLAERVNAGETVTFESLHRRKDGTIFPIEARVRPFWQGDRRFFLGVARDITERKQAEEALRHSEKQLRDVIETIPAIAWTNQPDGSLEFVNKRWQDFTGMSLEQSEGFGWERALHPNDVAGFTENRRASLTSGDVFEGELRLRHGETGEYRWFLARAIPLRDDEGKIVRWYGTATDIDVRKRAEERLQRENVVLREEIDKASMFEEVVGAAPALQAVLAAVSKVAPTDSTVLITGETGTGKELIARAIHKKSGRSGRAFVTVNCAAIPESLIASELFGHEKGAFTGALQRRLGKFELADGGTVFLDEVGELPLEMQIALLRVLQEREFERVGGSQTVRVDVRVITATNRDLRKAVASGSFRQDLFYRLNVFPIHIPPLRERKQDIPVLAEYFIARFARKAGKTIRGIEKSTLQLFNFYSWPGNIRELQNVIERAVVISDTETLAIEESWLATGPPQLQAGAGALGRKTPAEERELIEEALRATEGRVSGASGAAAKLGIPASTLEYKIRLLKINKHQFKKYLRES
jgi:PAS domain S-box-containing protein